MTQCRQNKLFHSNQKALYEELGGKRRGTSDLPQTGDARNSGVSYGINLFSIRKMLSGW